MQAINCTFLWLASAAKNTGGRSGERLQFENPIIGIQVCNFSLTHTPAGTAIFFNVAQAQQLLSDPSLLKTDFSFE